MTAGSQLVAQARTELGLVVGQLLASLLRSGWGKAAQEEGSPGTQRGGTQSWDSPGC